MEYEIICQFTPEGCPNLWWDPMTGELQHRCFVVNRETKTLMICNHAVIDMTGAQARAVGQEEPPKEQPSVWDGPIVVHVQSGLKSPNKFYSRSQ